MLRDTGFFRTTALLAVLLTPSASQPADACTRAVFVGNDGSVITGRSMDWKVDVGTNLWIFPRGIHHTGRANPRSLAWTSKYGSVVASGY
jgi:penicillin V acylase-like amidase (Ntn superfamily)